MAKVEADTAEDAYKAVVGELNDWSKARIIYKDIEDENETSYEVYEDDEEHKTSTLKGTYCNY